MPSRGSRTFLKPYRAARQELPSALDEFEELTSREQRQRQQANELTLAIRRYLDEFAGPVVQLTERGAAQSSLARNENDTRINDIRRQFKRILKTEDGIAASPQASQPNQSHGTRSSSAWPGSQAQRP